MGPWWRVQPHSGVMDFQVEKSRSRKRLLPFPALSSEGVENQVSFVMSLMVLILWASYYGEEVEEAYRIERK